LERADAPLAARASVCTPALAVLDGACNANLAMLAGGVAYVVRAARPPPAAIDAALAIEPPDAPFAAAKPSGFAAALVAASTISVDRLRIAGTCAAAMSRLAAMLGLAAAMLGLADAPETNARGSMFARAGLFAAGFGV